MSSSAGMLIIYVVAFIAIFYFMAIRPQQKQRKAHQALLSSLQKGDRIITAAGIYGTVKRVEESLVVVEVAKGVTIKIARNAVSQIVRDPGQARAFAPEPTGGRRGKKAPAEIEEETYEAEETVDAADEDFEGAEDSAYAEDVEDYVDDEDVVEEDEDISPEKETKA